MLNVLSDDGWRGYSGKSMPYIWHMQPRYAMYGVSVRDPRAECRSRIRNSTFQKLETSGKRLWCPSASTPEVLFAKILNTYRFNL